MHIKEFLSPNDTLVGVSASDKTLLLRELSNRAATSLRLNPEKVAGELLKREGLGSTGVGGGVAIPHARMKELKKPYGLLASLATPVEFASIDANPVDIVFLLLLPVTAEGTQLNALAAVTRALRNAKLVAELRHARDGGDLYRIITGD